MSAAVDLARLTGWIRAFARMIGENARYLTELDAAIGDADHGINMDRGMTAVVAALDGAPPADMAALCKQVGMTLVRSVGGASGPCRRGGMGCRRGGMGWRSRRLGSVGQKLGERGGRQQALGPGLDLLERRRAPLPPRDVEARARACLR